MADTQLREALETGLETVIGAIDKRIGELSKLIDGAKQLHKELLAEWATMACPFKVGDTVVCIGWAHTGKDMVINHITAVESSWRGSRSLLPYQWKVTGNVLKADGTHGQREAYFEQYQWERVQEKRKHDAELVAQLTRPEDLLNNGD